MNDFLGGDQPYEIIDTDTVYNTLTITNIQNTFIEDLKNDIPKFIFKNHYHPLHQQAHIFKSFVYQMQEVKYNVILIIYCSVVFYSMLD